MAATITPRELSELRTAGKSVELIDVRMPTEFREVHVDFARNVPLDQLVPAMVLAGRMQPGQPLYVICKSGSRARQACEKFEAAGFTQAINVEGGTTAWDAAGLPVIRGKKAMSLERQVRIAAGSLVALGIGLSFVHPIFLGLSAFVGCGLIFSGITDLCPMANVLAAMPWNQIRKVPTDGACSR